PDERNCVRHVFWHLTDLSIGPSQILAPDGSKFRARRTALRQPLFDRAVAAHLAGRQVAEAHGIAERDVACDGPTQTYLEVVGVRTEHKEIDGHGHSRAAPGLVPSPRILWQVSLT